MAPLTPSNEGGSDCPKQTRKNIESEKEALTSSDKTSLLSHSAAAAAVLASATKGRAGEKEDKFLADIKSDDEDVRYAAWDIADQMDPEVIPALSELLAGDKPRRPKSSRRSSQQHRPFGGQRGEHGGFSRKRRASR